MPFLIAESTNQLAFTPAVAVDSVTLAAEVDGDPVDLGTPSFDSETGAWVVDVQSTDVPDLWSSGTLTWTLTEGTQTRVVTEPFDVVDDLPCVPPIGLAAMREHLRVTDHNDDPLIWRLLTEATDAMHELRPLTWPAVAETRSVWVDGARVDADELVTASAVTDLSGNAHTYIVDPGYGLILHTPYTGTMRVTGTWGGEPPLHRQRSVRLTAATWYRRATTGDDRDFIGSLKSIPDEAIGLEMSHKPRRL